MAINKIILIAITLLAASLVTAIVDNIIGFHISKYNLIQGIAINLPRMATGFIIAWILITYEG